MADNNNQDGNEKSVKAEQEEIQEQGQIQKEEAQQNEGAVSEEVETLKTQLMECQAKVDEYLDGWQRSRAEFANYRRRIEREQSQVYQNAAGNIIKRFLEVADDLERAMKNRPAEGEGAAWADGIDLIYRKLVNILENEGVTPMKVEGESFDPTKHEAVTSEETDKHESGEIIEVLQKGYMLGDRVLRPAMVRVAR